MLYLFEDILKKVKGKFTKKKTRKIKVINDVSSYNKKDPTCLSCGSKNISYDGGIFVSGTLFRQKLSCDDCAFIWYAILNKNLEAETLEIEIDEGELK